MAVMAKIEIREAGHSGRVGHASITQTLDTYGHLFPGQDEELASRLDEIAESGGGMVGTKATDVRPLRP